MCKQWDTIQLNIYISFRISNQCTASIIFHIQQHNFFLLFLLAAKLSILFLLHSVDRIVYNLLLVVLNSIINAIRRQAGNIKWLLILTVRLFLFTIRF